MFGYGTLSSNECGFMCELRIDEKAIYCKAGQGTLISVSHVSTAFSIESLAGRWAHFAVVKTSNAIRYFVDGQ